MAFVLQPMRHADLDRIYPDHMAQEAYQAAQHMKETWPQDMHGKNWALDLERNAFLLQLPLDRERGYMNYLFGMPEGYVRLQKTTYSQFKVQYVSPALLPQANEVKEMIAEAFRISGEWMSGATDPNDDMAVPNAIVLGL